jgi:thiamine biosynthesis lipoprotein
VFVEQAQKMMGTVIRIAVESAFAEKLISNSFNLLQDYEKRFSANDDTSLLMRVNKFAGIKPVQVDKELFELIQIGKLESLKNGTLNIAMGPVVKLWHIGFSDARFQTPSEI